MTTNQFGSVLKDRIRIDLKESSKDDPLYQETTTARDLTNRPSTNNCDSRLTRKQNLDIYRQTLAQAPAGKFISK